MFLKLQNIDITKNTYICSWTFMDTMAREGWKCNSCLCTYCLPNTY